MEKKGVTLIDDEYFKERKYSICWNPPKLGESGMDEDTLNLHLVRGMLKLINGGYYDKTQLVWFSSQEQADSFLEFVQASMRKIIRIRGKNE